MVNIDLKLTNKNCWSLLQFLYFSWIISVIENESKNLLLLLKLNKKLKHKLEYEIILFNFYVKSVQLISYNLCLKKRHKCKYFEDINNKMFQLFLTFECSMFLPWYNLYYFYKQKYALKKLVCNFSLKNAFMTPGHTNCSLY